nr:Lytic transglycosylase [uncultured bacterium]
MKALILLVGLILAARFTTEAAAAPTGRQTGNICGDAVALQEQAHGIPDQLLSAISMVESGRWDEEKRAGIAWPWTVTSGGSGKFFPTKAAAIAEVRRLREKGVKNIDVGCMQINLMYHADAFDSLEEAFDPATNTAYAADFLTRLYDTAGSWLQAAASYHSMEPQRASYYRQKVVKAWNEGKRTQAAARTDDDKDGAAPLKVADAKPVNSRPLATVPPFKTVSNEQLLRATIASHAEQAARVQADREAARAFAANWRLEHLKAYEASKAQKTARAGQPAQRL